VLMIRSIRVRMIVSVLAPLIIAMLIIVGITLGGVEDVSDDLARETTVRTGRPLAQRIGERLSAYSAVVVGIALTGGALSAGLALASARRVVRSIRELASGARRIAEGDLSYSIPAVDETEIQALVERFNLLGRALDESRSEIEQKVALRTSELSTLLMVSHNVASTLELGPLLGVILEQLRKVVDYTGAAIMTLEGDALHVIAYRGPIPEEEALHMSFSPAEAQTNRRVIESREPMVIPDVPEETALASAFRQRSAQPADSVASYMRSWMGIPLIVKGRVIAMLSLHHSLPNFYAARHRRLATAFADQVAVAIENARLFEQAQELAAVKERERLARELHDSVTQSLYAMTLYAAAATRSLEAGRLGKASEHVAQLREGAHEALRDMRLLIFELRPPELVREGLAAALQARLKAVEARVGLKTEFEAHGEDRLFPQVEEGLYRIAQEALNNVLNHARARNVLVSLRHDANSATLVISDDGIGFDPASQSGTGLRGIAERAALLGGSVEVSSAPGKGTTLKVALDLDTPTAEPKPCPRSDCPRESGGAP
jgi:signal transduction histidine kinase